MYKNMLKVTVLFVTLIFFVSCQEKKEMKKDNNQKNNSYENYYNKQDTNSNKMNNNKNKSNDNYYNKKNNNSNKMNDEKSNDNRYPSPKCCINDNDQKSFPDEKKDVLSKDIKPEENLPLEKFKTLVEKQKILDVTENENDMFELEE